VSRNSRWIDGSAVSYSNWDTNQAVSSTDGCAEIYGGTAYRWHDNSCSAMSRTVCKRHTPFPTARPPVFEMTATTIDESGATSSGSPQLVQKDGVACVELDNDAKHYDWSSLDIGPTAMPTLTLDITFFATAALGYGWLLGDENGGCDRTVLLNDPRIGAGKTGGSCMSSNWGTPAINWGQWNRMSVYWDQNTQTAFAVVNGVKGNVVTGLSHNAGYGRLRLGAAWGGHESNVCVSSFRVYDRAPTAAEIAAGALAGPPPVQRFHCREGANGQCYSASISCFGSCASMANWKAPTYTGDYAGFQAFCSSWAANGGVFNGGQGECPK